MYANYILVGVMPACTSPTKPGPAGGPAPFLGWGGDRGNRAAGEGIMMGDFASMLDGLTGAEQFFDGPIPRAIRRGILYPHGPGHWRSLALESAERLRRYAKPMGFYTSPERRAIARQCLPKELEYCRSCVKLWRAAKRQLAAAD